MRPIYWAWAENILELDMARMQDPNLDGGADKFQDYVININFGLANYGHLVFYNKMGNLLLNKKRMTKELKKVKME